MQDWLFIFYDEQFELIYESSDRTETMYKKASKIRTFSRALLSFKPQGYNFTKKPREPELVLQWTDETKVLSGRCYDGLVQDFETYGFTGNLNRTNINSNYKKVVTFKENKLLEEGIILDIDQDNMDIASVNSNNRDAEYQDHSPLDFHTENDSVVFPVTQEDV